MFNRREASSPAHRCNLVCILRIAKYAKCILGHSTAPVFTGAPSDIAFPSLTDTLPSFPRYAALPRSEYYDGSAPPAPSAGVAPIPTGLPGRERKKRGERSRMVPTFTAVRSTGEAPGSTPAASPRLRRRLSPWPLGPNHAYPAREFPTLPEPNNRQRPQTTVGAHRSPARIHRVWSWPTLKRRNNTGSSRIPSRLAHRARSIRQYWTDPTSSRLLPPSPAIPGPGCRQLHPTATTARHRRSPTSVRSDSASWRTRVGLI